MFHHNNNNNNNYNNNNNDNSNRQYENVIPAVVTSGNVRSRSSGGPNLTRKVAVLEQKIVELQSRVQELVGNNSLRKGSQKRGLSRDIEKSVSSFILVLYSF